MKRQTIGATMVLSVLLSTLLPLGVVVLFLASGTTSIPDFTKLSNEQLSLVLGFSDVPGMADLKALPFLRDVPLVFMSVYDTLRIFWGLALCLAIILAYCLFIVGWNIVDLVMPLRDLRAAMGRIRDGDLRATVGAMTANELGELAVDFNRMARGLQERDKIKGLFGQYLTREISDAILDGRVNLNGARYEVTVMFTDIRGFTAMAESLEPEEVFAFLNEYFSIMIDVVIEYGGIIDKFLGDGMLAVFGLPVQSSGHAEQAVLASMAMRLNLADLNERRAGQGKLDISVGIGLHSGTVIAGNLGSEKKAQFTVIGDTVNLASRIQGMNAALGSSLLLSEQTFGLLEREKGNLPVFRRIDDVEIRGKRGKVVLYSVADGE
jgi:adenylate cyclase